MRILLGIVGQYRTFEKTYANIYENLIFANPDHKFDIILNTDIINEDVIDPWNKEKSRVHYDAQELYKKFEECYGNNLIKVIDYNVTEDDKKNGALNIFKKRINITSEYIKENSLNYQLYVFIRFDVYFSNKVKLDRYFNNSFNFICRNLSHPERLDHHRDWDFCWIFSDLLYNDYFNARYTNGYLFKNNVSIDQLLTFSNITNFKTGYISLVKKDSKYFENVPSDISWIRNLWIIFYNMYENDCLVNFDEEHFTEIQR